MSLEAKGTIKYDPEAKIELTIKAPTLSIEEEVEDPDPVYHLPELVTLLQDKIKLKVEQEFGRPVAVFLETFSLSITYSVTPIQNRTLDEFADAVFKKEGKA